MDINKLLEGKYKIIKVLGKGGMGTVYLCENVRINKLWAIKEIKKDKSGKMNFISEPHILKNLNHPGIPKIIDFFYEDDNFYLVEEYIEGITLKEYVKTGKLQGKEEIYQIMAEICSIIDYLHNLKEPIIYRDLKPSNIMITPEKKVILIDFGISKKYRIDNADDTKKLGSNGYAAPEQYGEGKCCRGTDIYGAGMVLYYMATGKTPATPLEPLLEENYDNNFDYNFKKIIQKSVQIKVEDRYGSIEELRNDIKRLMDEDAYEKTQILNNTEASVVTKAFNKNRKVRNSNLKKSFIGLMALVLVILIGIYFWYKYGEDNSYNNMADKPSIGGEVVKQPNGTTDNSNIDNNNSNNNDANNDINNNTDKKRAGELKPSPIKGKVRPPEKNKRKNKNYINYDENND